MLFLRRHSNERDIFSSAPNIFSDGVFLFLLKTACLFGLKQVLSNFYAIGFLSMPFLKEREIRRRKKCSEHLKELDRNVGETEVDQTDANPGTDYKDICWQDGRRIVFPPFSLD
jgi:hypothetical protein